MKVIFCLAVIAAVVGNCNHSGKLSRALSDRTIEYQSGKNEYSVVVVEMQGLSMAEARRIAEIRAAEMAFEDGYRYVVFETAQKTEVVQTENPSEATYGNLYNEVILDNNFDRDRIVRQAAPNGEVRLAYRFVFKATKTKTNWRAVDVCTLASNCKNSY